MEVLQLLAGRDFAVGGKKLLHDLAVRMSNFCYAIIDVHSREAILIDPCWDIEGILRAVKRECGVTSVRASIFTHRHFDHTGGQIPPSLTGGARFIVEGLSDVLKQTGCLVGVGEGDIQATAEQTGVDSIVSLQEGADVFSLGSSSSSSVRLEVLETPGHTPGSLCFLLCHKEKTVSPVLISGDTLFIGSCGRIDLRESDARAMLYSLERLSRLPPATMVLPGHNCAL